jgi:four helix bundle protein
MASPIKPTRVRDFEDLLVWQKAVDLTVDVYRETRRFPREELFGITSQIRKAATSIASNIAEGNGRETTKDYLHFLATARGSLFEVRSLLTVSRRLGFLAEDQSKALREQAAEIGRMLSGLRASLKRRMKRHSKRQA